MVQALGYKDADYYNKAYLLSFLNILLCFILCKRKENVKGGAC